mgnify:FL=1
MTPNDSMKFLEQNTISKELFYIEDYEILSTTNASLQSYMENNQEVLKFVISERLYSLDDVFEDREVATKLLKHTIIQEINEVSRQIGVLTSDKSNLYGKLMKIVK